MNYKLRRLTEDIRRELTDIMHTLKDPRIQGLISIVKVDLSKDESHCKVYISSLDGLEAAKRAVEGLNSAAGFIRREIGLRVEMRRSPAFQFVADDSIAYSADIAQKLSRLTNVPAPEQPNAEKSEESEKSEDSGERTIHGHQH